MHDSPNYLLHALRCENVLAKAFHALLNNVELMVNNGAVHETEESFEVLHLIGDLLEARTKREQAAATPTPAQAAPAAECSGQIVPEVKQGKTPQAEAPAAAAPVAVAARKAREPQAEVDFWTRFAERDAAPDMGSGAGRLMLVFDSGSPATLLAA